MTKRGVGGGGGSWASAFTWLRTSHNAVLSSTVVDSSWNVMAHGDAREGKWRGNLRMEWVASTLHTTSEHGVSSIPTADAHSSAASSQLKWRPRRFKWTLPFRRKTKSGSCTCAITFQLASTSPKPSLERWTVYSTKAGACAVFSTISFIFLV